MGGNDIVSTASQVASTINKINCLLDQSFTDLNDLEGVLDIFLAPKRSGDSCLGECDGTAVETRSKLVKDLEYIIDRVQTLNTRINGIDSRVVN